MAMSGFICHDDYLIKTSRLSDEELGRVFRALMRYHKSKEEPDLDVVESMAFDFIKVDIDRAEKDYQDKCDKNREIRMNAIENERQRTLTNVHERDQEKKRKEKEKENEKEKKQLLSDDDAHRIQQQQDHVLNAAEDAGFKMSNNVRASLIRLYADHGQKVIDALGECSRHGAPNIAYLEAVLKGDGKQRKEQKDQYEQRDYGGEDDEAVARMMDRMRREAW